MQKKYEIVSGVVFGVVALLQLLRAINQWPVQIDNFNVPVSVSWITAVVTGALCVWAFSSKH